MKNMKTKVLAIALAVCLIAIASISTLAWFTAADSVTNDFLIANSEDDPDKIFSVDVWEKDDPDSTEKLDSIAFPAILPGDDLYKEVNIENTGSYDQYIRATVTVTDASVWQEIFGEIFVSIDEIVTDVNADYELYSIVYDADVDTLSYIFYYNNILAAGEFSTLFTNVHIANAMDRFQAADLSGNFQISVFAEAVQTRNVGSNAVEAFKTVGMDVAEGNNAVATTVSGLWTALNANLDITLTNDIDASGFEWAPLCSEAAPFTATFNGNGYTIANLTISADNSAMFAAVVGGTVENVNFKDVDIDAKYGATVASYAENANFGNIEILSGSIDTSSYGAGVVFEAYNTTIKNCTNNVNVNADFSASGIGGWVYTSTVDNCVNNGDLVAANRAGGICGNFSGTMTNCTNNGDVTSTGNMPAGGIIGVVGGATTIDSCTNNGNVTTTADNANASAAGILAQSPSAKVTITNCTNNGVITAEQGHAAGIGVSLYGGITAEGCTNTAAVNGADGSADIVAAKGVFGGANTVK